MDMLCMLDRNVQLEIIRIVLSETKFAQGFHKIESREWTSLAKKYGFDQRVYCCIKPSIVIYYADQSLPDNMRRRDIDLRRFQEGVATCKHEGITLHWEEGGGALDNGTPFYYDMCRLCGHHPKKPRIWFSSLMSSLWNRKSEVAPDQSKFFKRV